MAEQRRDRRQRSLRRGAAAGRPRYPQRGNEQHDPNDPDRLDFHGYSPCAEYRATSPALDDARPSSSLHRLLSSYAHRHSSGRLSSHGVCGATGGGGVLTSGPPG